MWTARTILSGGRLSLILEAPLLYSRVVLSPYLYVSGVAFTLIFQAMIEVVGQISFDDLVGLLAP